MRALMLSVLLLLLCTPPVVVREERQFGLHEAIPDNCGKMVKIDTVINGPMGTVKNVTFEKEIK